MRSINGQIRRPGMVVKSIAMVWCLVITACSTDSTTETSGSQASAPTNASTTPSAETNPTEGADSSDAISGTITMLQNTGTEAQWDLMIEGFESEHPDVTVDATFIESGQLSSVLSTQFAAGNAPDMFFVRPGRGQAGTVLEYAEDGLLADLSDSAWASSLYEPVKDGATLDGKAYAWLMDVAPQGVYYDQEAFQDLGLSPPESFAEVLEMCSVVQESTDKTPIALSMASSLWGGVLGVARADQEVYSTDPTWSQSRAAGEVTFAGDPGWERALEQIAEMNDSGCFGPAAEGVAQDQVIGQFATQTATAMFFPAFLRNALQDANPDLEFGYLTLPADSPDESVVPVTLNAMIAANSDSENLDAAKAFIAYVAGDDVSRSYADVAGTIAPVDATEGVVPDYMSDHMAELFAAGRVQGQPNTEWPNPEIYLDALGQGVQGLFTGQSTTESILEAMDDAWDNG